MRTSRICRESAWAIGTRCAAPRPRRVRAGDAPLAGDAFVNQRLAVANQRLNLPLNLRKQYSEFGIPFLDEDGDFLLLGHSWHRHLEPPQIFHRELWLRCTGHEKRKILGLQQSHEKCVVASPSRFEDVSVIVHPELTRRQKRQRL